MAKLRTPVRASEIAEWVGGQLVGPDVEIVAIRGLDKAGPCDLSFVRDANVLAKLQQCGAAALVAPAPCDRIVRTTIVCADPLGAMVDLLGRLLPPKLPKAGIHPRATVAESAVLGKSVSIGANVVIGERSRIGDRTVIWPNVTIGEGVTIGDDCRIFPSVVIHDNVEIGSRVKIDSGSVVGGEGFGFILREGGFTRVPQVGRVVIKDDVEIGANVTIDRAMLDETIVHRGVKIDNHSHIAHNVEVGENAMLIAYAKIAGGAKIGKNALLAEDVGINEHITIGEGSKIGGGSKVYKSVPPGAIVWGSPARPIQQEKRIQATLKLLPEMRRWIRQIAHAVGISLEPENRS